MARPVEMSARFLADSRKRPANATLLSALPRPSAHAVSDRNPIPARRQIVDDEEYMLGVRPIDQVRGDHQSPCLRSATLRSSLVKCQRVTG